MKKSIWVTAVVVTLCVNAGFAAIPTQDKPVVKTTTTTTVKKAMPVKAKKTTKMVHKSHHVKHS